MAKATKNVLRKKRGRPATGQDPVSAIRLSKDLTTAIDRWAGENEISSRSEAIRRLVEFGLTNPLATRATSRKAAVKAAGRAAELAAEVIDKHAHDDHRDTAKRRLIKGPSAFREMRKDRQK